jgi:hypothetical protein
MTLLEKVDLKSDILTTKHEKGEFLLLVIRIFGFIWLIGKKY